MQLRFYWRERFGELEPDCESATLNRDGVSVLCSLLTDTGGLPYLSTVPWLEEGLRLIETVKRGEVDSQSWGREDWGADFTRERAKISSHHEVNYAEIMSLDAVETALRAWVRFIQTPPDASATLTIIV